MIVPTPLGWLSPARRSWPLVGLVLTLTACPGVGDTGPAGPEGPPGDPGTPGTEGPTGETGYATLIDAVALDRGSAECAHGGTRYDIGLDNGDGGGTARDGVLQSGEVDESSVVCASPGTVSAYEIPEGPAGTATIDARGGQGGTTGGRGGTVGAVVGFSGGHAQAYTTGAVDTSFSTPAFTEVFLGSDPLIVPASTTFTPKMINPGSEGTLLEGDVFGYHDGINGPINGTEDLYFRRSNTNVLVTGIRVEAGGTLIVPVDSRFNQSIVSLPYDIHNLGTITTPLSGTNRFRLAIIARHYFGEAGSRIDLAGGPGTVSVTGGEGGVLSMVLATERAEYASYFYYNDGAPYFDSEPSYYNNDGQSAGGFYNHGAIDTSAGALGNELVGRGGAQLRIYAHDEIYNTGTLTSRSTGSAQAGSIYLTGAEGGIYDSGTIDVRGSGIGSSGGPGGYVEFNGAEVVHSGTVLGAGGDVPANGSCTTACIGGTGAEVRVGSRGGDVRWGGTVDVRGGAAFGSGGVMGTAGNGGSFVASATEGSDDALDAIVPAGDVEIGGTFDLRGGAGSMTGGYGGEAVVIQYGGEGPYAQGQSASFLGYASIDLSGGGGFSAGEGGVFVLYGGLSFVGRGPGPSLLEAGGGAAINTVPVNLRGGSGIAGTQTYSNGGYGGEFALRATMPVPAATAQAVNRAPIDVRGGPGSRGGGGGQASLNAAGLAESTGALDVSGADGSTTDATNGYGGSGGYVSLTSQYADVGAFGTIDVDAGGAYTGASGGYVEILGREVDVTANVTANGGSGTSGSAGEGGYIEIWSADTFSVVTGTVSVDGATGTPASTDGEIWIDGFDTQSPTN